LWSGCSVQGATSERVVCGLSGAPKPPHPPHHPTRGPLALRAALCTLTAEFYHRTSTEKMMRPPRQLEAKAGLIGGSESTQRLSECRCAPWTRSESRPFDRTCAPHGDTQTGARLQKALGLGTSLHFLSADKDKRTRQVSMHWRDRASFDRVRCLTGGPYSPRLRSAVMLPKQPGIARRLPGDQVFFR
jgi:hypothetical protein